MKIKELSGTNLIAVEVPIDAKDFYSEKIEDDSYELQFISGGTEHGRGLEADFKILGTVTKDKIGFNVGPYVDKYNDNSYRDYQVTKSFYPDSDTIDIYLTKSLSFYSMLEANGLTDFEKLLIIEKK